MGVRRWIGLAVAGAILTGCGAGSGDNGSSPSTQPSARPSSPAKISILSPSNGEVFHGSKVTIPVRLALRGGLVVPFTSTKIVPNEGHIHLFLDGNLVSMTYGLRHSIRDVPPGTYRLTAEFVAVDHVPWNPRVRRTVRFRVSP